MPRKAVSHLHAQSVSESMVVREKSADKVRTDILPLDSNYLVEEIPLHRVPERETPGPHRSFSGYSLEGSLGNYTWQETLCSQACLFLHLSWSKIYRVEDLSKVFESNP